MGLIACNHSEVMKSESVDMEIESDIKEVTVSNETISLERLSSQKLIEYLDLIKLRQQHPEFESGINAQLLSFTKDSSLLNYPKGFTISNIKQIGVSNIISDSLKTFTLGFTITTESNSFKDSVLTEVRSKEIYIGTKNIISKKLRFLKN